MRYISSQMTGVENYNFARFDKKALHLRCHGIDVHNPTEHESNGEDWARNLAADIIDIGEHCDEYEGFGTWSHSFGAWLELLTAIKLGKRIILPWYQMPIVWAIRWWMKPKPRTLAWKLWDLFNDN